MFGILYREPSSVAKPVFSVNSRVVTLYYLLRQFYGVTATEGMKTRSPARSCRACARFRPYAIARLQRIRLDVSADSGGESA
jgi:hypothetical protein